MSVACVKLGLDTIEAGLKVRLDNQLAGRLYNPSSSLFSASVFTATRILILHACVGGRTGSHPFFCCRLYGLFRFFTDPPTGPQRRVQPNCLTFDIH